MKKQQGITTFGSVIVLVFLVIGVIVVMKVAPSYIDYFSVEKVISAMGKEDDLQNMTSTDIRKSFERRSIIDNITSVTPADLDIRRRGGQVVVSVAYSQKVHLVGNISLLMDFHASSASNS